MSLLGKILLFLVLLATGGFAYLGMQDYKGRQNIEAVGLRYVLILVGLPLGGGPGDPPDTVPTDPESEIPFKVEMGGGTFTETISPKLLQAYFAHAGGGGTSPEVVNLAGNTPVLTQLAEVKRVYGLIKGDLDKKDGSAARARPAADWLLLQAESYEERSQILTLLAGGNGDELTRRLYSRFDRVINPVKLADVPPMTADANDDADTIKTKSLAKQKEAADARAAAVKDEAERRIRLAHLLVHLDRDPAWQKRVMLVVGVRRYVQAVGAQAARFREMAARVERFTLDDQDRFVAEYAQLRGLAIERTQMVRDMAEVRARQEEQKRKDEEFVAQRKTQLAQLRAQLERVKAEVDALLARQTAVEKELYAVEREVALTLEDIYRLEAELIRKEREAYGLTPKQ